MEPHVYKLIDIVGTSETSVEDAVQTAISRAGKSVRNIRWFEIIRTSGRVDENRVTQFQVEIRVGFTLKDEEG